MPVDTYNPVRLDLNAAVEEAKSRPGFETAWNALEEEYSALNSLLTARKSAGLTQETLAARMGTTKSAVSRLEASLRNEKSSPSYNTLKKYAHACGKKLIIQMM